jgi:hypothetical protein
VTNAPGSATFSPCWATMPAMQLRTESRALLNQHALVDKLVDLDRVHLHTSGPPAWYLRTIKRGAMTLGDHIWFASEAKRDDLPLVAHELVHVGQFRELGRANFLWRYGRDLAKAGFKYSKKLPLEAPAYARHAEAKRLLAAARDTQPVDR